MKIAIHPASGSPARTLLIPARGIFALLVTFFILLVPNLCFGCTPIFVEIYFMGPTFFGTLALSSILGVLLAIVIKIIVFVFMSDYKSVHVVWMILLANIISTLFGVLITFATGLIGMLFFGIIVAFVFFYLLAKKMKRYKIMAKWSPGQIAMVMTIWYIVIFVLYIITQSVVLEDVTLYWIFKIIMSTLAMGLTLLFSVVLEETVIAAMYKKITKDQSDKNFLRPVLWGNLIAFLVVFGIGAAKSLPTRLRTPGYLNPEWEWT